MIRRALPAVLAANLLICSAGGSLAAGPSQGDAEGASRWEVSPELLAQAAGAVAGFGAYSLLVAPQLTAAEGVAALLGGRLVAATLAGAGAVTGTFLYDTWNGSPLDYAYFWHRGGFIGGLAAGIAVFGVLGYPIDGGSTWLGWAANRVTLLGAGMAGAWATDRWYQSIDTTQASSGGTTLPSGSPNARHAPQPATYPAKPGQRL